MGSREPARREAGLQGAGPLAAAEGRLSNVSAVSIRLAAPADVPRIVALVVQLAVYEREPDAVALTPALLHEALFGVDPVAHCHVATAGDEVVGIALWFRNFSTWVGRPGIYLEDLFVVPEHRRSGFGRALIEALAEHAVARGYGRLEWSVLDWNAPSIAFYRSLGAVTRDGWSVLQLVGEPMAELARSGQRTGRQGG